MDGVDRLRSERMKATLQMRDLKTRVTKVREKNVELIHGLWKRAENNFQANGTKVHWAKNSNDACKIVAKLAKGPIHRTCQICKSIDESSVEIEYNRLKNR